MKKSITLLPGDGIGPEIVTQAKNLLDQIGQLYGHQWTFHEGLVGGAAWDAHGCHLPDATRELCEQADALLFGAVGGPVEARGEAKWEDCERNSILALRKHFQLQVNLRPTRLYSALSEACILRKDLIEKGIDILCVRELSGDVYFGEHRTRKVGTLRVASDVMVYDEATIATAAHAAFQAAQRRQGRLCSVDKANVLDCSRLWRAVVNDIAKEYPDVQLEHMYVDNCAMQLLQRPSDFDVLLLPNLFGDILSDEVSIFAGSLGMLPSASMNAKGFGLYEPSGGSAPDLAGKDHANPIGQILSAAMMLKYSFGLSQEHDDIVQAVELALNKNYRTPDLAQGSQETVGTQKMGQVIQDFLKGPPNL